MKKGFTLAELIGVIVVLALISLITIPAISKILRQNKESLCETQMNNIKEAARAWGADNIFLLPEDEGEDHRKSITLGELITSGYIQSDIENPATKEIIDVESVIYIEKVGKGKWKYTLSEDFSCDVDED